MTMRTIPTVLIMTAALAAPAAGQTLAERMRGCGPAEAGVPLVGTVTEAETGRPIEGAVIIVDDYPLGMTEESGCYTVIDADEIIGPRKRVRVHRHRYEAPDTVIDIHADGGDTVHFVMRPAAPACCSLNGEWRLRLVLDSVPRGDLKPRAYQAEGTMVFSTRLPPPERGGRDEPEVEQGRFDVDLSTFFGGPYARDVSTTVFGPTTGDFFQQAAGEVFSGDSVMVVMIPGMSHGGLSLEGSIRGDTVRGRWVQNAYCCGATGRFEMHRVPPSHAGDSLIARGIRATDEMRRESGKQERGRKTRVGYLRLRVWDEGAGRYAEVSFAAQGHETNPGGGTTILSFSSGANGWGQEYEFEPGTYDLLVYEYPCEDEVWMPDEEYVEERMERITVTIEPGQRTDKEIRLDLCAIKPSDWGTETAPVVPIAP